MSASKKYGYIDDKTGKIETLPLATMSYDPVKEAKKLYGQGKKVVYYQYSISRGNWGEAIPWTPETDSKKAKAAKHLSQPKPTKPSRSVCKNSRTIRDLTSIEKENLITAIKNEVPNNVIVQTFGLKRSAIDQYRFSLKKKGTLKKSDSPAVKKSTPSTKSSVSTPSTDNWQKADKIWSDIKALNEMVDKLTAERKALTTQLKTLLQEVS